MTLLIVPNTTTHKPLSKHRFWAQGPCCVARAKAARPSILIEQCMSRLLVWGLEVLVFGWALGLALLSLNANAIGLRGVARLGGAQKDQ